MVESQPTKKKLISVVVPCFNEEENIPRTYHEIKQVLESLPQYRYEIIFVDNGSEDDSVGRMREICRIDAAVSAVLLSRNFGPESSALAGLQHARGDAVALISADLQDPPSLIPEFVKKWEEGYDVVLGQAVVADGNPVMLAIRRIFYGVLKKISYIDIPTSVTGFGLFSARFGRVVAALPEKNRFGRGLMSWAGFRRCLVSYKKGQRKYGKSSYNFIGYIKHAEQGIFSFTTLPLDIITYSGIILVALSLIAIIVYAFWVVAFGNPIAGSATLFLGIMFFGGVQILSISVVGKYIGIIFEETKNRPHFIVREVIGSIPPTSDRETFRHGI